MSKTTGLLIETKLNESLHLQQVRRFMKGAGQATYGIGVIPAVEDRRRQAALIAEEAGELIGGLGFSFEYLVEESVEGFNLVETIDGALDLRVVSTGVLVMCGLPDISLQNLVDENNLAKLGPGSSIREDGKLQKPDDHRAPDVGTMIADILLEQGETV